MKYLLSILFFQMVSIASYTQSNKSETVALNKVILSVNATVHASVHYEKEGVRINEELNSQLIETVEYGLVRYNDDKHIGFELISNKNRMTILGKGSNVDQVEGIGENRDDFTYSIDPGVPYPLAGVTLLTAGQPYKIQIYISDFYRDCNGSASGTSRFVSGWEGDAPTYETVPVKKVQTHVSTAVRNIFESPEDVELAMKGELTELQRKLQGSFTPSEDGGFFASGKVSHSYNKTDEIGMMFNGSLTISWSLQCGDLPRDDSPQITLNGCNELSIGEQSEVTAKAADEGGSFRFWAEPEEMFTIETTGATAKLMGSSPGRGKLFVEYTSAQGKTKQTSMDASCVSIESYNGGEAIPQIALFDIDGKKKSDILTVPVKGQPENATELVRFEPANPGVLSAEGAGSEVTLQGIKIGKTTLQAKTKCGVNTGPEVEVEVVNCDDETIARLEKMKKAAIENLVAATKDLQSMAGSKEFEKARDELVSSYVELLAKVGLTIVTGGKTKGIVTKVVAGKDVISKAIPRAAQIADYGSALSEIIGSSNTEELAGNVAKPTSGEAFERIVELKFGETTKDLYGKSLSAVIGLVEVGFATDKFYDNVGKLVHHEDMLEKFKKMMEKAERDLEYIQSRQNICKRQKGESDESEIPLADLPPLTDKPTAPTKPTPPTKQADTPVQEPKNNETPAEKPTTDEEVLVDPEPPTIPPRQVGLPYEPDDCGCDSSKNLTVTAKDLSTLGAGLKNLGECAKNFKSISVTDYQNALTELSELTGSLSSVLETDAAAFLVKAKESKPQLDALVKRIKTYDEAGNAFLNKMEKCSESVTIGMEIFQSVEKITIDSIKTKY
jgi:hypothetical protein